MKVVTLDEHRFEEACAALWREAASVATPDIVVGIRTGGYVVAETMIRVAPAGTLVLPITRRRASTAVKNDNPWVGRILRALPYAVTDRIRLLEHALIAGGKAREKAAAAERNHFEPDPDEAARLRSALAGKPGARVLVVDDAVDTGATLRAVVALVGSIDPNATVRSAVLVTTTKDPVVKPDVSLFTNALCRFPWSHDFAG